MTEQQITELVSQIHKFEESGNFMRIYFEHPKDVEALKKSFSDLGITEIIKVKPTKMSGSELQEYMFELGYRYSDQKKVIDDLERKHDRIKALTELWFKGGLQMTEAEKAFFAKKDMELAATKMKKREI